MTAIIVIGFLVADTAACVVLFGVALTSATARKRLEVERRVRAEYLEGYRRGYEDCMNMSTHLNWNGAKT